MFKHGDMVTPIPWDELSACYETTYDTDGLLCVRIPSSDITFSRREIEVFEGFVFEVDRIDFDGEIIFTEDTYEEFESLDLRGMFYTEEMLQDIHDVMDGASDRDRPVDIPSFLAVLGL